MMKKHFPIDEVQPIFRDWTRYILYKESLQIIFKIYQLYKIVCNNIFRHTCCSNFNFIINYRVWLLQSRDMYYCTMYNQLLEIIIIGKLGFFTIHLFHYCIILAMPLPAARILLHINLKHLQRVHFEYKCLILRKYSSDFKNEHV